MTLAAVDDAELRNRPGPQGLTLIYVGNKNSNASLKVTVRVSCTFNSLVKRIDRPEVYLFPRQFEVVIPAGGEWRVGQTVYLEYRWDGATLVAISHPVTFEILGAVYIAQEPRLPEPVGVPEDFAYQLIPTPKGTAIIGINLNCVWGISGNVNKKTNPVFAFNLSQFQSKLTGADWDQDQFWKFNGYRYVTNIPINEEGDPDPGDLIGDRTP